MKPCTDDYISAMALHGVDFETAFKVHETVMRLTQQRLATRLRADRDEVAFVFVNSMLDDDADYLPADVRKVYDAENARRDALRD